MCVLYLRHLQFHFGLVLFFLCFVCDVNVGFSNYSARTRCQQRTYACITLRILKIYLLQLQLQQTHQGRRFVLNFYKFFLLCGRFFGANTTGNINKFFEFLTATSPIRNHLNSNINVSVCSYSRRGFKKYKKKSVNVSVSVFRHHHHRRQSDAGL